MFEDLDQKKADLKAKQKPVGRGGYIQITKPGDICKSATRGINAILMSEDIPSHAGQLASLNNSWVAAHRAQVTDDEISKLRAEMAELRALLKARK